MALAFESRGSGRRWCSCTASAAAAACGIPWWAPSRAERRVIAVDLPGFADSPQEDFEPTPAGFATHLERWFAEQGLVAPMWPATRWAAPSRWSWRAAAW